MRQFTAVIVQARFGSTRLPGKVLKSLAGHSVLEHVLHRCQAITEVDAVCCAVPNTRESEEVALCAERFGVHVFRGSEHDVLDRYYQAARWLGADVVMRVTSDCPLIDPNVCSAVLRLRTERNADYACNNMPRTFPHGLDCEAFTFVALEQAAQEADDSFSREHVTPWLRNHAVNRCNLAQRNLGANPRLTLDYMEDFEFFTALFAKLPAWPAIPSTTEVLQILAQHPEITALNRHLTESTSSAPLSSSNQFWISHDRQ